MPSVGLRWLLLVCAGIWTVAAAATYVPMTKRGNVRYGPSTKAPVIVTLPVGTKVELLGPAEGRPGWYEITFPEQGGAYMHRKVLNPTANPEEWSVAVEGASVRADSRISAELVGQLRRGTVVRHKGFKDANGNFKGTTIGEWLKVYPTGATAFVYQSVIGVDQVSGPGPGEVQPIDVIPTDPWHRALKRYSDYRKAYEEDKTQALLLDWADLANEFDLVAKGHENQATRVEALRLLKAVRQIVPHARQAQQRAGVKPKIWLPRQFEETAKPVTQPKPAVTQQSAPSVTHSQPQPTQTQPIAQTTTTTVSTKPTVQAQATPTPAVTSNPTPAPVAAQPEVVVDLQEPAAALPTEAIPAPAAASGGSSAMGWLEQRDVPGQSANHVLIDGNGSVCAVIQPAEGADLSLAQYFWRRVTAEGSQQMVSVDGNQVPLITATAVRLATR